MMICFHNCCSTWCLSALLWVPNAWSLPCAEVFYASQQSLFLPFLCFFPYPWYQPLTCFQLQSQRKGTSCSFLHQTSELLKPVPADIGRDMMISFRCHELFLWPLGPGRNRLFLYYKRCAEEDMELLIPTHIPTRQRTSLLNKGD